ncbi:Putative heat shock protein YegD [Rubellimicrobium mesophilum DSM 19309]|uniref:Putative heat shock protein YegD n=1 Tax=Rubellimicrobium mesophilum DSM 19309 TaxID=442562 RepID=A0A017HP79_9RHOB|nr:Hsp70 family protein [Rubellimicrobium mesophilum]EYD75968.1 Putative heat shock protein YegD [Rubellimicrobium mesophilum DSM 19309]
MARWLGVDFGTSNTSAAVLENGRPRLIELEPGRVSVPTAVFLDYGSKRMLFGTAAVEALVGGREGRFLRALKRVLGTPLMRERRQLLSRRMTLVELVGEVLARVRTRAEDDAGERLDRVVAGRPVVFHAEHERDVQAAVDLEEAYRIAGFEEVAWLTEPEAAARACGVRDGLGIVVDIGGGTSDFAVFAAEAGRTRVLASEGVRVGGTDADKALSLAHAMPLLGMGTRLKAQIGSAMHEVPVAPFHDLATWERIGFLQTPEMTREAARMWRLAERPERIGRLQTVLESGLGFDLAFAVEEGKIAANGGMGRIDLAVIEPGLGAPLDAERLARDLGPLTEAIAAGALRATKHAGVAPEAVTHVVHVGGSSLLDPIRRAMADLFPRARPVETAAFTAVAEGLALAAGERS